MGSLARSRWLPFVVVPVAAARSTYASIDRRSIGLNDESERSSTAVAVACLMIADWTAAGFEPVRASDQRRGKFKRARLRPLRSCVLPALPRSKSSSPAASACRPESVGPSCRQEVPIATTQRNNRNRNNLRRWDCPPLTADERFLAQNGFRSSVPIDEILDPTIARPSVNVKQ